MQAQLTVRLTEDLDKGVAALAKKLHLKRADIVRIALQKFLEGVEKEEEVSPYDKIHGLIGSLQSGIADLGEAHREHLLKKFKSRA